MRLTALPAAQRLAQPWKNGGGTTREVAVSPGAAGFEFDWRVSLAQVDAGGPFSRFAGVDRILTVLDGAMRLAVEGREPVTLDADADAGPYAFAGDADCSAELIAPVVDLNVMTRRGAWTATVTRLDVDGETRLALTEAVTLLVVAQGRMRMLLGDRAEALDRHDAVRIEDGAGHGLIIDGSAVAYRIDLLG